MKLQAAVQSKLLGVFVAVLRTSRMPFPSSHQQHQSSEGSVSGLITEEFKVGLLMYRSLMTSTTC